MCLFRLLRPGALPSSTGPTWGGVWAQLVVELGRWWVLLLLDVVDAARGSQVPGGCGCRDSQASGTWSQLMRIFQVVVIRVGSRFA